MSHCKSGVIQRDSDLCSSVLRLESRLRAKQKLLYIQDEQNLKTLHHRP